MPANVPLTKFEDLPCCPQLDTQPICDVLDFRRRLVFPTPIRGPQEQPIKVEVVIHTRFTRCSGPLALGDIAYTTTLLPGEQVRLATTDRRSRFSFDSESKLSYRSEQISEEQYRLRSLRAFMSDENVVDRGNDNFSEQGKWDFHGDASGSIGFFSAGADANARGSHSASSAHDYLREHRAHAEMSDNQSVEATRRAHSVSIGEVSSRSHTQGESEDHFEASSREFTNHNQCHAVTFLFYRINKTETIKFELVGIERRVLDPATPIPKEEYLAKFWIEQAQSAPSTEDYDKNLLEVLQKVGCGETGAPYVIRGLLRTFDDRFKPGDLQLRSLAAAFLDAANCPGARGLSEEDNKTLRSMRDTEPAPPGRRGRRGPQPAPKQ